MRRRLPPFAAIRAFEAAARHCSFRQAAEELCLSPSAISHQVRALEDFLATELFRRQAGRLSLTAAGRAYRGRLTDLLDRLDASTREAARAEVRQLRVLATPGFAARWLLPRLHRLPFARDIRLRVSDGAPCTDFASNDADVVIQWADAPVAGVVVEPLIQSGRLPVISPALRDREGIERPEDLLRVPLFHDEVMDGWPAWFAAAGMPAPLMPRGPCFAHCELSSTAAERGQGVALAYEAIIRDTLAGGSLVRLFSAVTLPSTIYSVAYPSRRSQAPLIRRFRDWLMQEAAAQGSLPVPAGTRSGAVAHA
ncbi:MAG: LysR substrate-binding domain-containing protein [Tranquillimonas sp.]